MRAIVIPEGVPFVPFESSIPEGLATATQLSKRYGTTAQTFANWEERHDNFPDPAAYQLTRLKRSARPLWNVAECDEWVLRFRAERIALLPSVPETETERVSS
jgi:hypothetical protein